VQVAIGVNAALPEDLRDLRVELGLGPEQQRATEVVARLDGCRSAWQHAALGFVWRDGVAWIGPGEARLLTTGDGARFEAAVHASARPLTEGVGRCRTEAIVAWSLVRRE
jgi:hypothetical protein